MSENLENQSTVKVLTGKETSMVINGKTYRYGKNISYDRWDWYLHAQVELGYASTFAEMFAALQEAYEAANAGRMADNAVILRNIMLGMKRISDRQIPAVVKLCSMFINYDGEDTRYMTEELLEEKSNDFRVEGISMQSFFSLALDFIPEFWEIFNRLSQSSSMGSKLV